MIVDQVVQKRYTLGAQAVEQDLCCPVEYNAEWLRILPREIVERDYGCGDPSRYVRPGETVLDLGSGGGKVCYIAAQRVGPGGRIIGVDLNDEMLALARRYQQEIADQLGEDRVHFYKGRIQDLALDLDRVADHLAVYPITDLVSADLFEQWKARLRREEPMIADNSVDLVISNCVLNLVDEGARQQLVAEIFRVLKPGGRVAISDIVAGREPSAQMKQDPTLWSGCIAGAFTETGMVAAFRAAGFCAVAFDQWTAQPWRVVEGIDFRSITLTAVKPAPSKQSVENRTVLYRGPFACVEDEFGNRYPAGERVTVTDDQLTRLKEEPFRHAFVFLHEGHASTPCRTKSCC
ncbi:MAG: methyltransferase domain-containing protein [Magnetococcales bacterium]|nr:methyltransferase domain-containing protein [Magnetococcales bacterium]MBF0115225.1 methyltransferase domain-containing protein [Magnetococcales bacterium]